MNAFVVVLCMNVLFFFRNNRKEEKHCAADKSFHNMIYNACMFQLFVISWCWYTTLAVKAEWF